MKKDELYTTFNSLAPNDRQKEKMLNEILKHKKEPTPNQRINLRVLVPVVAIICIMTTTVLAAHFELDKKFLSFLNPSNYEQAQHLANGAYAVNKQVKHKNGTLDIKQVIGDSSLTYILMDFTAPKGTVLDASRYRFQRSDNNSNSILLKSNSWVSWGFTLIDDGNPFDNKISLVMNIQSDHPSAGEEVTLCFTNLSAAGPLNAVDPLERNFKTILTGHWQTSFKMDFKDSSTTYPLDEKISMYGYDATLKSISISPISITLEMDTDLTKEISKAANDIDASTELELDPYAVTINFNDGTSETTTFFTGSSVADNLDNTITTIKTFKKVINDKEIKSLTFFGKEIHIN